MLTHSLDPHRAALFGLCYRMTGSAADAEDLVQETFRKVLEHPPPDLQRSIRPWLFRVASNLCIDALRRRQRERYFGPWLPSPVETERIVDDLEPGPEARYDLVESATSAFLTALEALDPRQRAVLVLRDVMGLTGPETATVLDTSPGNVRVVLHRARKRLEAYDRTRRPITPALRERTGRLLRELTLRIAIGDLDGVARLLATDVTSVHDGGGEFVAALRVHRGIEDVMGLYAVIKGLSPLPKWFDLRDINGLPAMLVRYPEREAKYARCAVGWIELNANNEVASIRSVVASRKLIAIDFPA